MRHCAVGRESGAAGRHSRVAGDAVVQPEDAAERRKASGVAGDAVVQPEDAAEQWKAIGMAGTCSGTAEDVAVWRMPRGC